MPQIPLVNGRLSDAFVNSSWSVSLKQNSNQPSSQDTSAIGEQVRFSPPSFDTVDFSDSNIRDITDDVVPPGTFPDEPQVDEDGKTIVRNLWGGIKVESRIGADGQFITFPDEANRSAAKGAATHGFFYHTTDFLKEAAQKYSTLGENETFRFRDIQDEGFIRDTLDFLTNGNYTEKDVAAMKEQMEDVVLELAQQIKDGKEFDLSSVQTKLTIGGSEIGVGQLFELQSLGKDLEGVLNQTSVGQMDSFAYAQKGLTKSIAEYYGKNYGAVGEMFADGIGRLYEKSIQNVQKLNNSMNSGYGGIGWSQKENDSVHTGLEISDLFANLDCSSKDAFMADFNAKLSDMRTLVQQFGKKYNLSDTYLGIAGDMANLMKYVQSAIR